MKDFMRPDNCAKKLRALADPDRLRIIRVLLDGAKNVGEIADALGVPQVNVSHHLGVLRNSKLLETERRGRFIFYRLPAAVYRPDAGAENTEYLALGCCRLEIPKSVALTARRK
jgi:DNA-binding transcriptional ArsR family regulator